MATPPQGRKMAPERPFPILIETGKSYPKTGLSPAVAVFRRFSRQVRRRFSGGFPTVFRRRALPETTPVRLMIKRFSKEVIFGLAST